MPRPRASADAKYAALDAVFKVLDNRTLARLRCVCTDFRDNKVPKDITAPIYSDAIMDICRRVSSMSSEVGTSIHIASEAYGIDIERVTGDKIKVMAGSMTVVRWDMITKCKPTRLSFVLWRMVKNKKMLKREGVSVEDLFHNIATSDVVANW